MTKGSGRKKAESFFKTLKTEKVYLMDAGTFDELSVGGSCSI